jgi:short-subunit dehydrogenase
MARDLRGRRILLTGSSRGIGRCLAEGAALRGARLVLAARSVTELQNLANHLRQHGTEVVPVSADVTVEEDRRRLIETAVERLGGLDVLINNAGVASFGHFSSSSEAVLRQVMEVNFFAPAELIRLGIPQLTKGVQPAIVNVASVCGRRGLPAWPEHSASKFALCGLTEALRGEMARFDIDVLLVLPGLTRSDLGRHLLRNEGRMKIESAKLMSPEQVAEGILQALERNRTETTFGWQASWLLRVNRFLPRLVDRLLARWVRKNYADEQTAPLPAISDPVRNVSTTAASTDASPPMRVR